MGNDARHRYVRLWRRLEADPGYKGERSLDLLSIALYSDELPAVEELVLMSQLEERQSNSIGFRSPPHPLCPPTVAEFITDYLQVAKSGQVRSILDPWADSLLLVPVESELGTQQTRAYFQQRPALMLAAALRGFRTAEWEQRNIQADMFADGEQYDAVVSCFSNTYSTETMTFEIGDTTISVRDNGAALALLKGCERLAPDGIAIAVVPSSFFRARRTQGVVVALAQVGLSVVAAIDIPAGIFKPFPASADTLIVVQRRVDDRMFVGQLSDNRERNSVLLQNLRTRKQGAEPALGTIVARSEYRGFGVIAARHRVKELAKTRGFKPRRLSDIAVEFTSTVAAVYPGFTERAHAIYVPLVGTGPVVHSLAQATLEHPSDYLQVVLNPDEAAAEYVAEYFNTTLGREARKEASVWQGETHLSRQLLRDVPVYLPDRETQLRTIETSTQIENLIGTLETLRERTWSQPRKLKDVATELQKVNKEDTFEGWLDTLPFPLASILWTYHTMRYDYQRKYERLLQFFEAQAVFLSAVLIAGFQQDIEWTSRKKPELSSILSKSSLKQGTFGVWVHIAENLAKEARTYLNGNAEAQNRCFTMFKTTDRDVLNMLFSSEIITALQRANSIRNDWPGHGGAVGSDKAYELHTILANLLSSVRRTYGAHWRNYRLVKAGSLRLENGVFHNRAELIMGTRTPFEHRDIRTNQPMEHRSLYLTARGGRQSLKLLPLIQVMPSPKTATNACYFYNRMESEGKLRFVSYHFEQDAEVIEAFPDTLAALRAIME